MIKTRALVTHFPGGCSIRIEGATQENRFLPPDEIVHVNRPALLRRAWARILSLNPFIT